MSLHQVDHRPRMLTLITSGLVTSIVRFAIFFLQKHPDDGTWSAVEFLIWTQVEPGVYLISACLMTYRPLLERIGKGKLFRKPTSRAKTSNDHFASSKTSRREVDEIPLNSRTEADKHGFHRFENDSFVEPGITVTTKISVSENLRHAEQHDVESGGSLQ